MLATYAAAALITAASLVVGGAILRVCGRRRFAPHSAAVGFAALVVVAAVAVRLPGHGAAAGAALAVAVVVGALLLRGQLARPSRELLLGLAFVAILVSLPFLANGRVGVLGVSFNNDMALHLAWTEWLRSGGRLGVSPSSGYPTGTHALAASVAELLAIPADRSLIGLMMAIQLLVMLSAASVLDWLPPARRALGATLVAGCYLMSSYYAEGAFKETVQALLLIGFVAVGQDIGQTPTRSARMFVPLGLMVAATVYNYSYVGLVWPLAGAAIWAVTRLVLGGESVRPRDVAARARAAMPDARSLVVAGLVLVAATAVLIGPELSRIPVFFTQLGDSPSRNGVIAATNIGNLGGPVPSFEAFGLWPRGDFRFAPAPLIKHLCDAFGLIATLYGGYRCVRARHFLLPAMGLACAVIYLVIEARESVYLAAKALAILAPFAMLVAVAGLLSPRVTRRGARVQLVAVAAFAAVAMLSAFMALTDAQVGARATTDELSSLRATYEGAPVLALVNDDFQFWELRGARPLTSFQYFAVRPQKQFRQGLPTDLDSATSQVLNRSRYVLTSRTRFASTPPAQLRPVRRTRLYTLFERRGQIPERQTLTEAREPGARLSCRTPGGRKLSRTRGYAVTVPKPELRYVPSGLRILRVGRHAVIPMSLPAGRWELSLQYTSPQRLRATGSGLDVDMPPVMSRPGGIFELGRIVRRRAGRFPLAISVADPWPLPTADHAAEVTVVAAVRADSRPRVVPLSRACGRYVDWYTTGPRPPRV